MAEFPTVNFDEEGKGLFSQVEIRDLMKGECARASRYGYALTFMMIGVDRLEQLGDLYGAESRAIILKEVGNLLRNATRESDVLGCMFENHFLGVFHHAPLQAGIAIGKRLIENARKLNFEEGGPSVHVTLSLGLASGHTDKDFEYDIIVTHARQALLQAIAQGGNRLVVYEPQQDDSKLVAGVDTSHLESVLERILHEKMETIFQSMGQEMPDFGGREREVLELAVERLISEHRREMEKMQRRVSKLAGSLEDTEMELRSVMSAKGVDPGVASIYRTVQGLSAAEENAELKKEFMSKIFEANLELREQMSG